MAEFTNTYDFMRRYGSQVESEIETRLYKHKKIASGVLYDSIGYRILQTKKNISLFF